LKAAIYGMIKNTYLFIVLLLLLSSAAQQSPAQQPVQESLESLWINLPSSPLRFFANQNGDGYSLNNYSIGYIVGYRPGCVSARGERFKILSKRPKKEVFLKPMSGNEIHGRAIVVEGWLPFVPCKKGTLTVIEVQFKDGSVWKVN
jgi:hypothetical protein